MNNLAPRPRVRPRPVYRPPKRILGTPPPPTPAIVWIFTFGALPVMRPGGLAHVVLV